MNLFITSPPSRSGEHNMTSGTFSETHPAPLFYFFFLIVKTLVSSSSRVCTIRDRLLFMNFSIMPFTAAEFSIEKFIKTKRSRIVQTRDEDDTSVLTIKKKK